MEQNNAGGAENDFAAAFENSLAKMDKLKPGQAIETAVVAISGDSVFLELSGKSEGVLDKAEVTDADGKLTVSVGESLKVFFLRSDRGEMRFTTRIGGNNAAPSMLENAYQNKIPVEGTVEKEIKGGFEVKIGDSRAFCPFSQMGARRGEDAATYIGKKLMFRIQEFKEKGRNILVSNRVIEEEARAEVVEELKARLQEGDVVSGTIKSIQDFGAFVDLGGVEALLPISELSRNRVEDIRAVLSVGQEVEAELIKIDWKSSRLTLSLKSRLADPWAEARAKYPKDSKHSGSIVRIADFGAFVELEPGVDGLVHVSELRGDGKFGGNPLASLKVGQTMNVLVLDVDVSRRRISLKPATSVEEDATTNKYLGGDGETYNPFAALLSKKK